MNQWFWVATIDRISSCGTTDSARKNWGKPRGRQTVWDGNVPSPKHFCQPSTSRLHSWVPGEKLSNYWTEGDNESFSPTKFILHTRHHHSKTYFSVTSYMIEFHTGFFAVKAGQNMRYFALRYLRVRTILVDTGAPFFRSENYYSGRGRRVLSLRSEWQSSSASLIDHLVWNPLTKRRSLSSEEML